MKKFVPILLLMLLFVLSTTAVAATPSVGTIDKSQFDIMRDERLEARVARPKAKKEEPAITEEDKDLTTGEKVLIKTIEVEDVKLLPKTKIDSIIDQYKGQELTVKQMQKICDLITDEYREAGFATSRAYLPAQSIVNNNLVINVVEGTLGEINVRGNKYFSTKDLKKKLGLKEGSAFDYAKLQQSLTYINEHPDRYAKAVLVPGDKPGSTNIVLDVEDRLPLHINGEFDTYGSRYVGANRYNVNVADNNLLGRDDKLYFKWLGTNEGLFKSFLTTYTVPFNPMGTEVGAYYLYSKTRLGKEVKSLDVEGDSYLWGVFFSQKIFETDDIDFRITGGFDYKNVYNHKLKTAALDTRDFVRKFKIGIDYDIYDRWARNLINIEMGVGVPHFMGGVDRKDPFGSRQGSGGEFLKFSGYYYRLQPIFKDSSILWKNQFQMSAYTLPAVEQFQIGGITNVRAYPLAENSGDWGYATSLEFTCPFFLVPESWRDKKIEWLSRSTIYDAARWSIFYDMGLTGTNAKLPGETDYRVLNGMGVGFRINCPEGFTLRVDLAWPLGGEKASDGDWFRSYIKVATQF